VNGAANSPVWKLSIYENWLIAFFLLSVPLINPWIRGDGVGYYAFARSLLIEHRLDFTQDWLHANSSFQMGRLDTAGNIPSEQYTATGHLDNHFSIGPALLWLPALFATHEGVVAYDRLGGHVAADGFSRPYVVTMGLATAIYGFLALWLAFRLARKFVPERWAFLATAGIWLASSLPVYMYLNPSWSHAQSAFVVALFLWYWDATREARSEKHGLIPWLTLGCIGGLMMDVYYLNVALLVFPAGDLVTLVLAEPAAREMRGSVRGILAPGAVFGAALFVAFLPTLIAKKIVYGSFFNFGYVEHWYWNSPALLKACFSSEHGLFSWTPLLIFAVAGLFLLRRYDRRMAICSMVAFVAFLYMLGCYQDWHGISSFGSRFFVSLTPLFVLGLAAFFETVASHLPARESTAVLAGFIAVFVLWNAGMIFQWGTHLIPARGPISWKSAAYNQVAIVPAKAEGVMKSYLTRRNELMNRIEQEDVEQLKLDPSAGRKQ